MSVFPRFLATYSLEQHSHPVSIAGLELLRQFPTYRGMDQLIAFLETTGELNLHDNAFRVVDPTDFESDMSLFFGEMKCAAFAISSFGDLYFVSEEEENAIFVLHPMFGWYKRLSPDLRGFFESGLVSLFDKAVPLKRHRLAVERLGVPRDEEIFGYEPIVAMGGNADDLESLRKVEVHSHLALLSQFVTVQRR
jgi:hypothetical protein